MMPTETKSKQKIKQIFRIRNFIILCPISLLIWWGSTAISKYWKEPLTTDTSFIFGDNENGIQFPAITIYDEDFYSKHPLLKDCYVNWDLIGSFVSCMKKDNNFLMESFMDSLQHDVGEIVAQVHIWTGKEVLILDDLGEEFMVSFSSRSSSLIHNLSTV